MEEGRVWRITRAAAISWGVAVAAVTAVILLQQFGPWPDARLPADETARQLKAQLGVEWTFSCTRQEADETIPADIDYYCHPSRPEEVGYFVDTDRASIEIVSVTG
jgi:hypothetical protein